MVEVTKPLYDRSRYFLGKEEPDQVVKPDFEAKVFAADGRFVRSLVVEVLGLDTPVYRARKQRLKQILTGKPGHYLEHLAHEGIVQAAGDKRFHRELFEFGETLIAGDKRKIAAMSPPAANPPPPRPTAPPPRPPAPPEPVRLPSQSDAPAEPLRTVTPVRAVGEVAPTATTAEPACKLGWFAHWLTALRGGR